MISWQKERDSDTTQLIHCMYDGSTKVAVVKAVRRPGSRFQVQIGDAVPWHRATLDSAKKDCKMIYLYCK